MPGRPCTLPVIAQATDPDGDRLTYTWSGCVVGGDTSPQTDCVVRQVGRATATVDVSDGHGHTVTASMDGEGTPPPPDFVNHPPRLALSSFFSQASGSSTLEAFGSILDPEEGELCGGGSVASCAYLQAATISGDCKTNEYTFPCGCMGGVEFDIYRTASSGTCHVSVSVRDSWGLAATSTFDVPYGQAAASLVARLDFPFFRPHAQATALRRSAR